MSLYSCSNWTKLNNKLLKLTIIVCFLFHFVGIAVVTETKAALWTDGRYYLQAESQLDSNWILMKDGNDIWWNIYSIQVLWQKGKQNEKNIDFDFFKLSSLLKTAMDMSLWLPCFQL